MDIPGGWTKFDSQDRPFAETARFDIMWADGSIYEDASGWEWDILMIGIEGDEDALAYRLSAALAAPLVGGTE